MSQATPNDQNANISLSANPADAKSTERVSGVNVGVEQRETDPDDGEESDVSSGGDLIDDLDGLLSGDFDFEGSFSFGTTCPQAPNPCISIDGLGTFGIPLGPRDAQAIIESSTRAPYGHGDQTVINTEVRDTWEIEPQRVSFQNPAWDKFMSRTIVPLACLELGVINPKRRPKVQLHKMLLYETGSHFLPHQDTVKAPGMFASIIIILPSVYTGGEVHVSHAKSTKVFDFAASSLTETSVLSWYTDVRHEVKPITSGYRWVLSYNLIHNSSEIPPTVPIIDTSDLTYVLKKWRKNAYSYPDDLNLVAYVLEHEYSKKGLREGYKALKGKDAHKARYIKQAADEERFSVCFGNLFYLTAGAADDVGGYCQGKPKMADVQHEELNIDNLVDWDGADLLEGNTLHVDMEQIVPKDYFEEQSPDDFEYEPYTGNSAGELEETYCRSVIVVMPTDEVRKICISAGNVQFILKKLERTEVNPPSVDNILLADAIITKLKKTFPYERTNSPDERKVAESLYKKACSWKDMKLWINVTKAMNYDISFLGADAPSEAGKAVQVFHFGSISSSLEEILSRLQSLGARMGLIESVRMNLQDSERELVEAWCDAVTQKYMQSVTVQMSEDVPILLAIMKSRGAGYILQTIVPLLEKTAINYDFWVAWLTGLVDLKMEPSDGSHSWPSSEYKQILDQALTKSFQACFLAPTQPSSSYSYWDRPKPDVVLAQYAERAAGLISPYAKAGSSAHWKLLLAKLLAIENSFNIEEVFDKTYIPFIRQLRDVSEVDIHLPFFTEFFKSTIVLFLRKFLGSKPPKIIQPRRIGCGGCDLCNQVDEYITTFSPSPSIEIPRDSLSADHLC